MASYYDYVLGLIPLVMGGTTAALLFAGFELTAALPLASLAGMALIGHAMFVNAPVEATRTGTESDATGQRTDGPGYSAD